MRQRWWYAAWGAAVPRARAQRHHFELWHDPSPLPFPQMLEEVEKRFKGQPPLLHPVNDMKISVRSLCRAASIRAADGTGSPPPRHRRATDRSAFPPRPPLCRTPSSRS